MESLDGAAILERLKSARLSDDELAAYAARAVDRDYWRRLIPELSIEEMDNPRDADAAAAGIADPSLTSATVDTALAGLREEGYFKTPPALTAETVERMRMCVERLRAERWPIVFTYLYDDFWRALRIPALRRLIAGYLGEGYQQTSNIWTYYVIPRKGAAGWPPHRDSSDGQPRLTVWIPLTEARLDNGCMYVIPEPRVPRVESGDAWSLDPISRDLVKRLLQSARALPAAPGSLLGWSHGVVHWGSMADGGTPPRISIAVEFIAANATANSAEQPLWNPATLPSFDDRIHVIGKALLEYSRFEPVMHKYSRLAGLLAARRQASR
jgi:hypothetical protein